MDPIEIRTRLRNTSTHPPLIPRPPTFAPRQPTSQGAIECPTRRRFDAVRQTISLITRVHAIRGINIVFDNATFNNTSTDAAYAALHDEPNTKAGFIGFRRNTTITISATLEEFAHALDHQAFTTRRGYATDTGDSDIETVLSAIRSSPTFQRVRKYTFETPVALKRGETIELVTHARRADLEYEQQIQEWFARAYVQFIAVTTGDAALMAELAALRSTSDHELLYPYCWPDDEFSPIAEALEAVLRAKNWVIPVA